MNLGDFLTPEAGQRRRAWLDDKMSSADEAMRYYLGPTGIPDKMKAVTDALNYTDAGDMVAAGDASRELWNNPSIGSAANYAAAGGALALPFYSARMGEGIADLADEAVRSYDPNRVNSFVGKIRAKYPDAKIDVSGNADRGYVVNRVEVPKEKRNSGVGTRIMQDIMNEADAEGATLALTPSGDFGGNPSRLKKFYSRLGFNQNKGANRDFSISEDMYRAPQPKASPQKGIRAYHGSPHEFDRFQMDKIGTGEGGQAYGHGLYFAENEDVARSYRDALSPARAVKNEVAQESQRLRELIRLDEGDLRSISEGNPQGFLPIDEKSIRQDIDRNKRLLSEIEAKPIPQDGSMYEVNINADPDDFLDWDAPLSEQSPKVREWALDNTTTRGFDGSEVPLRDVIKQFEQDGLDPWNDMGGIPEVRQKGQDLHYALNRTYQNADHTAREFRDAGIPGIKYRDAGSRGTQEGTRNYVVFDENLVEIVRKYGIAGAAAMLGVSAMDVEGAMAGGDTGEAPNMAGVLGMPSQGTLRDYLNQQPKDTR